MIRFLISVLFVVASSHFAWAFMPMDSVGTHQSENGKSVMEYMVEPGETIYRISSTYGVSISELMELNPSLQNGLKVGQMLNIPYRKESIRKEVNANTLPSDQVHEVKPGETLYSLSKKYNVSIGELLKWNGMELKAGQKLIVKDPNPNAVVKKEAPKKEQPVLNTTPSKKSTVKAEERTQFQQAESAVVYENPEKPTEKELTLEKQINSTKVVDDPHSHKYKYNPNLKQVLIIPFDPHLYFSDADDEMAQASNIPRVKVREVFRRRLNALLDPDGYEVIHLMGGRFEDTLVDLNKVYSSVSYNYQEILDSPFNNEVVPEPEKAKADNTSGFSGWVKKQGDKVSGGSTQDSRAKTDRFEGKFFGVKVSDPTFFDYFQEKYSVDYFVFINQFEVITDYEHCLDRAAQNYARYFIAHYTIMGKDGQAIAGNKYKIFYDSNSNDVMKVTADNMGKMSQRIINDLPKPGQGY